MVQLTAGYVAGFIAAATFAARIWSPNALTFILSGILRDRNSAATWTAASSAIQKSNWPWVLQSDSARNHGVRKDILALTWFITAMSSIIAIAGVVTPLGLYETLAIRDQTFAPFSYAEDPSSFGFGTPPRSDLPLNRVCNKRVSYLNYKVPCPFTSTQANISLSPEWVNSSYPNGYQNTIPASLQDAYSSGTDNSTTISNYFDIEWRRYQTTYDSSDNEINNGSIYLVGSSRMMASLVLNNNLEPVEGILADTINGGIGFRNHTVPMGLEHGATWKEDLLFIEPETACVNLNVTLDFEISVNASLATLYSNVTLTDRGGFVDIVHEYPRIDLTNTQADPKLSERAYKAAWMTNAWTMLYYNITTQTNKTTGTRAFDYINSVKGARFWVPSLQGDYAILSLTDDWYSHFGLAYDGKPTKGSGDVALPLPTNPLGLICSGAGNGDRANITNIFVKCGLMRGVPKRVNPGSSILFDAGSKWSQPIYACASAVKATIKTATLVYNGTKGLEDLKVDKVEPKKYAEERSKPLWGVENVDNRFLMDEIDLLWGLVADKYEGHPNISTVRQESLYLPGYPGSGLNRLSEIESNNLPASTFYRDALNAVYDIDSGTTAKGKDDYSGSSNMGRWARWQQLSVDERSIAKIPGLVFVDYAASSVVGTKGILGRRNAASENVVPILVAAGERRIRYHVAFAIPAIIALLGLILMTLGVLITALFKHHNIQAMRHQLPKLFPGRIFTTFLHPELGGMSVPSKEWSRTTGKTVVDITGDYPHSSASMPPILVVDDAYGSEGKGPGKNETLVSNGSTESDQFLGQYGSPPIPQPYLGAGHHLPVSSRPPQSY